MCAIDADKLDLMDLENTAFNDIEVDTHRIDIVGHGYDELVYSADDGGFDYSGATIAASSLIDTSGATIAASSLIDTLPAPLHPPSSFPNRY